MEANKVKVSLFLDILNNAVKDLEGKKYNDMADYHNDVKNSVLNLAKVYGLTVNMWGLRLDTDEKPQYKEYIWQDVFKYILESEDDKRSKYTRKPRVIKTEFVLGYDVEIDENTTLWQYYYKIMVMIAKGNQERIQQLVKQAEKELEELKEAEKQVQNELTRLLANPI